MKGIERLQMTRRTRQTWDLDPYPMTLRLKLTRRGMGTNLATTELLDDGQIIVVFDATRNAKYLRSAAVHESVHVCQFVQEFIQTEFDNETEAYFIETVSKEMIEVLESECK